MCWVEEPPHPDLVALLHCSLCCGAASSLLRKQQTEQTRSLSSSQCSTADSLTLPPTAKTEALHGRLRRGMLTSTSLHAAGELRAAGC